MEVVDLGGRTGCSPTASDGGAVRGQLVTQLVLDSAGAPASHERHAILRRSHSAVPRGHSMDHHRPGYRSPPALGMALGLAVESAATGLARAAFKVAPRAADRRTTYHELDSFERRLGGLCRSRRQMGLNSGTASRCDLPLTLSHITHQPFIPKVRAGRCAAVQA